MTTMWLMVPSADAAGDAPAAGNAVSASNDASTPGTTIRTPRFMLPPPCLSLAKSSGNFRFTRMNGRNQEDPVKAWSVPGGRRGRTEVDALRHLHRHRGRRERGDDDRGGGAARRRRGCGGR